MAAARDRKWNAAAKIPPVRAVIRVTGPYEQAIGREEGKLAPPAPRSPTFLRER
jgi:hypothetical protein